MLHLVDDFYFSVLSYGRNDADTDDELFPISDEMYAVELQFQEVIMSSAVGAATTRVTYRATTSSIHDLIGECSSSSPSSSSPSVAARAVFLFCKICMDAVPPSNAHTASRGCAHAFCTACLHRYIGTKIQDRIADVKCPEENCISVLDPELCRGMLPREVFERWADALFESMVLGAKKTYCPFKNCSAMMVDDRDVDGVIVTESECPSCRRLFCARCAVPWHGGVSCAEYRRHGKGSSEREDLMLLEMAKGKKWQRCPRCKFFVEKSEGCLHITCRCGFEFCYGCGMKWGVTHSSCSTT